jgi:hypothetical protein
MCIDIGTVSAEQITPRSEFGRRRLVHRSIGTSGRLSGRLESVVSHLNGCERENLDHVTIGVWLEN